MREGRNNNYKASQNDFFLAILYTSFILTEKWKVSLSSDENDLTVFIFVKTSSAKTDPSATKSFYFLDIRFAIFPWIREANTNNGTTEIVRMDNFQEINVTFIRLESETNIFLENY